MKKTFLLNFAFSKVMILTIILLLGCTQQTKNESPKESKFAYELGVVAGFSELINAGVKKLALSAPMTSSEMDEFIKEAIPVAQKHNVLVHRESELIVTDLFPSDIASNQDVLLLYQETVLAEYLSLKEDKARLEAAGKYNDKAKRSISRRFGRLLSYSPKKINQLLSQNTPFRTMDDFGIKATNLFLYYKNLKQASSFYQNLLGLQLLASYDNADIFLIAGDSYLILVDASKGMHSSEEPKTVALALLTNQLDQWYEYLKSENVNFKYEYKPKEDGPHDGFVVVDPEGYLLEFEKFKQHKENENFIPLLNTLKSNPNSSTVTSSIPKGLEIHSSITWLYYKDILYMQEFYEDVMGLEMVADQGWAKIYQASNSGFIGLVDEKRGMHQFSEKKAVNVSFIIEELDGWFDYVREHQPFKLRKDTIGVGPDKRYRSFVGFDPEGYYLEFDTFYEHEDNHKLLRSLDK